MRRQKECKRQRVWRLPGKQVPLNQLSKAHMISQRPKQQAQGLPGATQVLCGYGTASSLGFYGTPECVNKWVSDSSAFS